MIRDSMVFYRSFLDAVNALPEAERLKAVTDILEYGLNGKAPETCAGIMAKPLIDRNNKRYENGRKGGRPPKPKDNQTETEKPKDNQTETEPQPLKAVSVDYAAEFNDIWKAYPRKAGKQKALAAYIRARKKGTTAAEVARGVSDYIQFIQRNKIAPQYVKHGATWFSNQSWGDDYTMDFKRKTGFNNEAARAYDMDILERELIATN